MGATGSVTTREFNPETNYESDEYFSSNDASVNGSDDGSARLTPSQEVDASGQPTHYEGGFVTNGIKKGTHSDKNLEASGNSADENGVRTVKYKVSAANTDSIVSALQDQGYIPNTPVNSIGQVSSAVLERAVDEGLLVWQDGELVVSPNYEPGEIFVDASVETGAETQGQADSAEASDGPTATSTSAGESAADSSPSTTPESTTSEISTAPESETRQLSVNGQSGDYVFSRDEDGNVSVKDGRGVNHQLTDEQLKTVGLTRRSTFEDIGTAVEEGRLVLGEQPAPDKPLTAATVQDGNGYSVTVYARNPDNLSEGFNIKIPSEGIDLWLTTAAFNAAGFDESTTVQDIAQEVANGNILYSHDTKQWYHVSAPPAMAPSASGDAP
jgi:hypothetical protein